MESMTAHAGEPARSTPYGDVRGDAYVILAAFLGKPPSEDLLKVLPSLQWDGPIPDGLDRALGALLQAGLDFPLSALQEEYDRLFVGLGSGEVVPYASWYRERTIQFTPLAALRSDLIHLGIVRQADSHEPEDHAAALCECMALIARKPGGAPLAVQEQFFRRHLSPWMAGFFKDLESAKSARFYRVVGAFGSRFMESETDYFTYGGPA
jgi:TorA maturation chaperone TorD